LGLNEHGFNVLAKTREPIDVVIRFSEDCKADFLAVPFIEAKLTDRYGYQVILGAYTREGEYPLKEQLMKLLQPGYKIGRTRVEISIPASMSLAFLIELRSNLSEAIRQITVWERQRGLR
jgi:hypothetical protein